MLMNLCVNGAPSELQLEPDALIWRPREHSRGDRKHPIRRIIKHLSSSSNGRREEGDNKSDRQQQQQQQNTPTTPTTIVTAPSLAGSEPQPASRGEQQVALSQIIGVVKVFQRPQARARNQKSEHDSNSETTVTSTRSESHDKPKREQDKEATSVSALKVYYAQKSENKSSGRLLKLKKLVIKLLDHSMGQARLSKSEATNIGGWTGGRPRDATPMALADLHDLIEQHLEPKRRQRPKKLLIFVNPFGGKGKGLQLFERRVKRVLELARIESELVVTQHANHAREMLEDPNFDSDPYDGIICVGGDGMFAELMNGLLFRYNRDRLLDSSNLAARDQRRAAKLGSNCDLASTSTSSSSSSSSPGLSATIDAKSEAKSDRGAGADASESNNNEPAKSNAPAAQSLKGQVEFMRASLGGIGERFYSPTIPIGVIGAGSTDANLFGFIGTNDATSATLNIVLGNQLQIDVCSIHSIQDDRLLRFVSTFVAYGYFGDVVRNSEKLRWLGPSRYDLTALNSLIKYRNYQGLVRILSSPRDGSPRDLNRCHSECRLCQNNMANSISFNDLSHLTKSFDDAEQRRHDQRQRHKQATTPPIAATGDDLEQFELIERRGSFVGVNAAVTACRCPQTRKGFSPGNHLANGCADLILVRPCSRMQYINYLIRTGYTDKSAFDLKYVEAYRCRQFEFIVERPDEEEAARGDDEARRSSPLSCSNDENSTTSGYVSSSATIKRPNNENGASADDNLSSAGIKGAERRAQSSWNADGEILREQSIRVKVNNKLLRVFGTGEPPRQRRIKG